MFTGGTKYHIIFVQNAEYQNVHPKYVILNPIQHWFHCLHLWGASNRHIRWHVINLIIIMITIMTSAGIMMIMQIQQWWYFLFLNSHPCAAATGSPVVWGGHLFVWNPILKFNIFWHLLKIPAFQDQIWMTNRMLIS